MEAAFCDRDKPVTAKSSVLVFGRPLYRDGLLSRDKMLSITRGWEQARVSSIVRDASEMIAGPGPAIGRLAFGHRG